MFFNPREKSIHGTFFRMAAVAALAFIAATSAFAVEFKAEIDREEIAQDESVSLKLVVEADGSVPIETPSFIAPNFEEIQNYQGSFVQSYYDSNSGKFGAKFSRSFTYVMRPKTTGRLTISGIKINVDGKAYAASPVTISVTGGGGGTPPPRGYGGAGSGLRGAAKRQRGTVLFLRTEVDRTKAYRGQQIIVNYYLYSRAQNFNATADRYPNLNGFLKEEMDVPILTGRLKSENVVLDGTAYKRVLVASFAAYPLKAGQLTIDPMEVKASYIAERERRGGGNADDPFGDDEDLFSSFFRGAAPQTENLRSESVTVDVSELPPVPKDLDYTGGVGEFDVVSAVDRTDVKAHEAVTLTLKLEGKGNLSSIETPKILLPEGVELYEAKSQTKGKAGIGEKVFEYLLIPRKEGDFTLPGIELGFFDPVKGQYVRKATQPFAIHVNPGDPGAENQAPARMDASKEIGSPQKDSKHIFDLGGSGDAGKKIPGLKLQGAQKTAVLGGLALILILAFFVRFRTRIARFIGSIGVKARKSQQKDREWTKVRRQAEEAGRLPFQEILKVYDFLEAQLEEELLQRFGIAARGFTRFELKDALVEKGKISEDLWQRIALLLEFTETVRYASQAGVGSEDRSRNELRKWVAESEQILAALRES